MSAKLTATEVTPCSMLEPERLCETRLSQALAMVAVIRAVVVLPLLPVITIFLALLAPITDFRILGSMRRATMPGKLVPPLTRSRRPVPPTSLPAEIANARRALPRPDGGLRLPLLCCISSFTMCIYTSSRLCMSMCRVQYSKIREWGQVYDQGRGACQIFAQYVGQGRPQGVPPVIHATPVPTM